MDIHKPKPWHGIREFLKEYAIIVVGVLTALGAEQSVEWLHWRHAVADAREALGREIAFNVAALRYMDGENACVRTRLDTLEAWAGGHGSRLTGIVVSPLFITLVDSTWQVANSGQALGHFPLDQQRAYARVYARLQNQEDAVSDERSAWSLVVALANQPKPDSEELRRLREAIGLTRVADSRRRGNSGRLIATAAPLSVGTATVAARENGDLFAYCGGAHGGS